MITALLSRPVDLLLALGLPRTPQLPTLLSPNSPTPLEPLERLLLRKRGIGRRELHQENREEKSDEGECLEMKTKNKIEQQTDDLGSCPSASAASSSVCPQSL